MRGRGLVVAAAVVALGLPVAGAAPAHAAASCASGHDGGDWPMFGRDLSGTRNQDAEHTIDTLGAATLTPAWTFDANAAAGTPNNEITGYPIEADGCIFVGSNTGFDTPASVFAINADTGELVWRTPVPHGIYSTLAVENGRVFAYVSHVGAPTLYALDESDGAILWSTRTETHGGSDAVGSPTTYKGNVVVGVAGTVAEGGPDRPTFQGGFVIMDQATGETLAHTYTIPADAWSAGYSGGSIWSTFAVDPETGYGYAGTGNPFNKDSEYKTTNSMLKVDFEPARATFGQIVGFYKGNTEQYFSQVDQACAAAQVALDATGQDCPDQDLDFGAQPNIFKDANGRTLVGEGQKSGIYHVVDPSQMTMDGSSPVWTSIVGLPSLAGGIVGSAAYDGHALYGPVTEAGYLWSLDKGTGSVNWLSPVADGLHFGQPVALANGTLYTVDLKGFLDAYDAATGAPLRQIPMNNAVTGTNPTFSWGGTTVARHTVYASVGVGVTSVAINGDSYGPSMPDGFVIAYRPALALP